MLFGCGFSINFETLQTIVQSFHSLVGLNDSIKLSKHLLLNISFLKNSCNQMKPAHQVTTIAGNGQPGFQDGNALEAMFNYPWGICCSNDGRLYILDNFNHRIRMIYNNQVTTIAGNGQKGFQDGNALNSMFNYPTGICCSKDGILYVTDLLNNRIRIISNNQVTTIAGNGEEGFQDGNALNSMFNRLQGICCSNDGRLYVSDHSNQRIRMIYNNQVTTIAGNGQAGFQDGNALEAMFNGPWGICCSNDGRLYVSDQYSHRIRMIYNNQVTTIAGNGQPGFRDGNALKSMDPTGICCSNYGRLYVSDYFNNRIRMIYNNQVTTIAGNGEEGFQDGNALNSMFNLPHGICCSNDGRLYVIDQYNQRIRMIYDNNQTILEQSKFGFAHLLDMKNTFADREISFKGVSYHLHSTLVNVRCPLLFDQSYFVLIEKSNISNKSFDSFVTFLYSDRLTQKEYNQTMTTMSIEDIVGLILIFDLLMDCKWILIDLKKRFDKQLVEMLKIDQEESVKKLIVELLPFVYNLKEMINKKPVTSKTTTNNKSYIEYCYNKLIDELQKKRSMITKYLTNLQQNESFLNVVGQLVSETCQTIETINDESMIDFEAELIELSKLAFYKTNICAIESETETKLESSISSKHLNEWTRPDFVINLSNDDDDDESISYHVHKLILCGRWKYFCQMIESGLKEANDNEMTLSDDWNKSRFEKMMKYIYLNEVEFDELKDVEWLMNDRQLYGITVNKSQIVDDEINDETVAYGFEALYDHCISLLGQPLM